MGPWRYDFRKKLKLEDKMITIKKYTEKSKFINDVSELINYSAILAKKEFGNFHVLLSGGSTPGPIYKELNKRKEFAESTKIALVDERFVPNYSEFSNEKLVRECFTNSEYSSISGMVYDTNDQKNNLKLVEEKYKPFIERLDLIVLGMGKDGHFASIFPNDKLSIMSINKDDYFFSTKAPSYPVDRISCSLNLLMKSTKIILLITGKEKLEILSDTKQDLPIHKLLKKRQDTITLYLEENE